MTSLGTWKLTLSIPSRGLSQDCLFSNPVIILLIPKKAGDLIYFSEAHVLCCYYWASFIMWKIWAKSPKVTCFGLFVASNTWIFLNINMCAFPSSSQDLSFSQTQISTLPLGRSRIVFWEWKYKKQSVLFSKISQISFWDSRVSHEGSKLKCLYHKDGFGKTERTIQFSSPPTVTRRTAIQLDWDQEERWVGRTWKEVCSRSWEDLGRPFGEGGPG